MEYITKHIFKILAHDIAFDSPLATQVFGDNITNEGSIGIQATIN